MDLLTYLQHPPSVLDRATATRFARAWKPGLVNKGSMLTRQGDVDSNEHIILDGRVISHIHDPDGRAVCVGLFVGPCVVTPNLARTANGLSQVSLEATSDAVVAQINSAALTELMLMDEPIREWANGVLRQELARKSDREWCLAALGGADRLIWFRERYPGYEDIFGHSAIASFLGMTPVTLSRLRTG